MNNTDDTSLEVSANTGGAEPILGASNEENQTLMSTNENTELLSESNSGTGSFAELEQYIIDKKGYEKTVTLTKDYAFNNETDSDYSTTGIYIGTFVTIDGQGHTIDAKNSRYIFNTVGTDITFKNINFKNTNYCAINVGSSDVQIIKCTFDNNTDRAVRVSSAALNCVIDGCTFINGGGLYSGATGAVISNSLFKNNTAGSGGAINIDNKNNIIKNCIFIENNATNGGAIYFKYDPTHGKLYIENSTFNKNAAIEGGAIYTLNAVYYEHKYGSKYNSVVINSSTFTENIAVKSPELGGPELPEISKSYIVDNNTSRDNGKYYDEIDSIFDGITGGEVNLSSKYYKLTKGPIRIVQNTTLIINGNGAIIDANGNQAFNIISYDLGSTVIITNLTVKNGYADTGAVYIKNNVDSGSTTSRQAYITNCNFINNTATNAGGAIYFTASVSHYLLNLENCSFENNTAKNNGGAVLINTAQTGLAAYNCNFTNNTANKGGAVYDNGGTNSVGKKSHTYVNCIFKNNSAKMYGALYSRHNTTTHMNRVVNSIFVNNSAEAFPASNLIANQENNTIIHTILDYINFGGYSELPDKTKFEYDSTISLPMYSIVNGNGSTIIGMGQSLFTYGDYDWGKIPTIANMTIINATISRMMNVENVTFINCTNPIYFSPSFAGEKSCQVNNVTFIDCSGCLITNENVNVLYDVTVDGVHYDNYELFDYFYGVTSGRNITLKSKDYVTLTRYHIFTNNFNIIIDGNNSNITGIGGCKNIFYVNSNNTVIKDLTLKNTTSYAIYFTDYVNGEASLGISKHEIKNINFTDCSQGVHMGSGTVINSTFKNCGQTITFHLDYSGEVIGCVFENITSTANGGAISLSGVVKNCNFTNIKALGAKGGSIYIRGNANIFNCTFIDGLALNGGFIYQESPDKTVRINMTTFNDGVAKSIAGAIYVTGTLILDDCELNNNTADSSGAIYCFGGLTVINSNLTNNSAVKAGAINSAGDNAVISNCDVSGNTAVVGAGISLSGDNVTVDNVTFTDNAAEIEGGALITTGSGTNITAVTATGNSANKGAAFSLKGDNSNIANSTIANNTGINDGNSVNVEGSNIGVLNNTIQNNTGTGLYISGNDTNVTNNHFNNLTDISIDPESNVYDQLPMYKIAEENYPVGDMPLKAIVPTIIAKDVTVEENTVFNITLADNNFQGNVSITVGDIVLYNGTIAPFKDGVVSCPVISVGGDKTAHVFFYGDNAFRNKTVDVDFIVSRITSTMNVTINNVTYGINTTAKINISNKVNGTVNITFGEITVNGSVVDGSAVIDLGMLLVDNYTAIIEFFATDSDYYNNVSDTSSFNVAKASSSIDITVNPVYFIGDDINITFRTVNSTGNLTVKINGTEYPVVDGSVNITDGLPLGSYIITAELEGDDLYNASTKTETFIVQKINTDLSVH